MLSKSSISDILGTLFITTSSSHNMAAGINATALFLAPLMFIYPVNLCPPSIFILDITTSYHSLCIITSLVNFILIYK